MEIRVLRKDSDSMLVEFVGETHTLTNLIREELWNDSNVLEAAEVKEHPYLSEPKIFLRVKKGDPKKALAKALERIERKVEEFKRKVK